MRPCLPLDYRQTEERPEPSPTPALPSWKLYLIATSGFTSSFFFFSFSSFICLFLSISPFLPPFFLPLSLPPFQDSFLSPFLPFFHSISTCLLSTYCVPVLDTQVRGLSLCPSSASPPTLASSGHFVPSGALGARREGTWKGEGRGRRLG